MIPIYVAFPRPALQLAAAIFIAIFHGKIALRTAESGPPGHVFSWEAVQTEILSGILVSIPVIHCGELTRPTHPGLHGIQRNW
jgi:hypothetical protein